MNEESALDIVCSCLTNDNSIPQELREHKGLDIVRFEHLVSAIEFLVEYYQDKNMVPKRLSLCFVDIYASFSFREGIYDEYQTNKIEDAGIQLQDLAYSLFC
ncbi:hypothetical protein GCM10022409_09150 [Hymenobacter glaciei]|uniref:Uncharacterized protein n=1 Tax=Hymenobacter glaciei TaxID=877209 RepID=A0ABP7TK46_9BACT